MERKWGFPRGNRRWISLQRGARISELLLVRFPSIYISIPLLSSSAQPPMQLFSFHKKSPYHHRRPNVLAWRRNVLFVYFCWQCYLTLACLFVAIFGHHMFCLNISLRWCYPTMASSFLATFYFWQLRTTILTFVCKISFGCCCCCYLTLASSWIENTGQLAAEDSLLFAF